MSIEGIEGSFKGKHFVSIGQIKELSDIEKLFDVADEMKAIVESKKANGDLAGYCVAEIFYQPSTRTFTSFLGAANWLGAMSIPVHGMSAYSSAVKGETLADTVRSLHQTTAADVIVLRHPDDDSSEVAAEASTVPIVNAGSGKKEHPTQSVLDLYTIRQELGRIDDLHVAMVGDLKNGRTIKSLAKLLTVAGGNNKMTFVAPDELKAPDEFVEEVKGMGADIEETDDIEDVIADADVLYVTRVQKEWFDSEKDYEKVKGCYVVDKKLMKKAKKDMAVMHPLPRVDEIATEVDDDPRAAYFRQMRSGLYTRMALLKLILRG